MATRVVIAEDEAIIRLDLKETLQEEGYDVVGETGRGDEAVRLVRELEPDLAILDINLGGEMVYDLVDALQAQGVPVVFATGYDPAAIPARYASVPLCQKPIDPEQIARAIFG